MLKKLQLWFYSYGWTGTVMLVGSMLKRERMSHDNGTTAIGKVRIIKNPSVPPHDFLEPGREFSARLRHASVSYADDTVIQVRSASLKFANSSYASPLDLEMNTGTISLFWTARNFLEFAMNKHRVNDLAFSDFYDKYPEGLEAGKDGIRKYPSSFSQLYYHSQCAQLFRGKDGVERYAKFRLIPENRGPETGLIPRAELKNRWKEVVLPDETRSPNYLKTEYADRIRRGPVKYHLQIQLATKEATRDPELFNCNIAWDEAKHPWLDIADVEMQTLLSLDDNNQMRFSLRHAPASLAVLPADSIDDYNSINYMRAKADAAKSARLLVYKILGNPKPVSEDRASVTAKPTPSHADVRPIRSEPLSSESSQSRDVGKTANSPR